MTREEEIDKAGLEWFSQVKKYDTDVATAFLAGAQWADAHPHWISVEDELPKEYVQVLCHGYNRRCKLDKGYIFTTCRVYKRDDYKRDGNGFEITDIPSAFSRVTHWMPLPKMPALSKLENIGKNHLIDTNNMIEGGEG